jgi:hypothetical protein
MPPRVRSCAARRSAAAPSRSPTTPTTTHHPNTTHPPPQPTPTPRPPPQALRVNTAGAQHVLELAGAHGFRVFAPSTIAVFGRRTPRAAAPDFAVVSPATMYGVTKARGRAALRRRLGGRTGCAGGAASLPACRPAHRPAPIEPGSIRRAPHLPRPRPRARRCTRSCWASTTPSAWAWTTARCATRAWCRTRRRPAAAPRTTLLRSSTRRSPAAPTRASWWAARARRCAARTLGAGELASWAGRPCPAWPARGRTRLLL